MDQPACSRSVSFFLVKISSGDHLDSFSVYANESWGKDDLWVAARSCHDNMHGHKTRYRPTAGAGKPILANIWALNTKEQIKQGKLAGWVAA